ncbi:divergent polysaccharide deacetylase family protein [Alteromonadaceae bacterium M269]|nr:divergent polysaccharide deacetylase family protein [Alteromonadaceae bacterium M269]
MLVTLMMSWCSHSSTIALIIDDMGNKKSDAIAFDLPNTVTFGILPHTDYSTKFAQRAQAQHREVILHVPMESLAGAALGPGAITSYMHPDEIVKRLGSALETVPGAKGINNHMGSRLTQLTLPMNATMQFLRDKSLYFVDSRTTRFSKAESIAKRNGIPTQRRHVFLDHSRKERDIAFQFQRLIHLSRKQGVAVGIAHPYPQTMAFLERKLPELEKLGVKLVPMSALLEYQQDQVAMFNSTAPK